jgi:hypothetical protein
MVPVSVLERGFSALKRLSGFRTVGHYNKGSVSDREVTSLVRGVVRPSHKLVVVCIL